MKHIKLFEEISIKHDILRRRHKKDEFNFSEENGYEFSWKADESGGDVGKLTVSCHGEITHVEKEVNRNDVKDIAKDISDNKGYYSHGKYRTR